MILLNLIIPNNFIEVDKNIKIRSWLIKDLKNYKTLLFFHGNAGNLFNRSYKLNKLSNEFEYPYYLMAKF